MLENILKKNKNDFAAVINFENKKLLKFDFSVLNSHLSNEDIKDTASLTKYVRDLLTINHSDIGYGGYLEDRTIYRKSKLFSSNLENARTIHLGIDIWTDAGEPVYAPLNGIIHSFKNNNNFGDYGPTIILEHELEDIKFFTLYGHLSIKSLINIKERQTIKRGEEFAVLGNENENGNWTPHLHFQIIADMLGNKGDFPGVVNIKEKTMFKELCPNPNLILTID